MAAPQLENGYTKIPNYILEDLAGSELTGNQFSVIFCLMRETWGWNREEASLSLGLVESMTGIRKNRAKEIIDSLLRRKIFIQVKKAVVRGREHSVAAVYAINKNTHAWNTGRAKKAPREESDSESDSESEINQFRVRNKPVLESEMGCLISDSSKKERKVKDSSSEDEFSEETIPDLIGRVVRQLTQLQPSGLSQEDRKTVGELLRNTDKTQRRVLEAVTDAVRQTQEERRGKQITAPIRYALRIAGRMLSEPEPMPAAAPEFVKAPEGWNYGR